MTQRINSEFERAVAGAIEHQRAGRLRDAEAAYALVKEELRRNAVRNIENGQPLFEGVMGYEDTVMPQLENALLAGHDVVFLGDQVTPGMSVAILVATLGVVAMSLKGRGAAEGGYRPVLLGLVSGAMFALSATGYRGAILSLGLPNFVLAATFTLTVGLVLQAALLSLYLLVRDRGVLVAIAHAWRPSLFAGFMGATASQFWFLAFALASIANVRTLALVEVLFAQGISYFLFKQKTTRSEAFGMTLIVLGVALLIWVQQP